MKLTWNSLKISLTGAKLSHLVQKDKIWDHGSMIEQAKTIFFKVKKAKHNGNIDDLRKYLTEKCFEKLKRELDDLRKKGKRWIVKNPVIKEVAIIEVSEGKNKKPDCFVALLKSAGIQFIAAGNAPVAFTLDGDRVKNFSEQWSFVRDGDWWILDEMK